jgi:formamidopyrimidine-DNA glycosylase
MPELPEVETVRQTLLPHIVGRRVERVIVRRRDVVHAHGTPRAGEPGERILDVARHGKQLAIVTDRRCVCIHLGMTGSLCCQPPGQPAKRRPHTHLIWRFDDGGAMRFTDPRRFGGIWLFDSFATLQTHRWARLGPDALTIAPKRLHAALARTRRPLKAALLDQQLIAGLGNIYVDELLFAARLHPLTPAATVDIHATRAMVRHMRQLLGRAVAAGGSTVNDYIDANGSSGRFQLTHKVYGHAAEPCSRCRTPLTSLRIAGRATVCCDTCQPIAPLRHMSPPTPYSE